MAVAVGSCVSVLRGVGVKEAVGVKVGIALAVWVDAALAVWTINVLIALASVVGTDGTAKDGTHATTIVSAVNQNRYFVLGVAILPLSFPNHPLNLAWAVSPSIYSGAGLTFPR